MIGYIRDTFDKYLGRGRYSIAVPVMDGNLHPNNRLEEAPLVCALPEIDNLASTADGVWFSSSNELHLLAKDALAPTKIESYGSEITFIASDASGALAIGVDGGGVVLRGGAHDGQKIETVGGSALICGTAAVFEDANTLIVTVGARNRPHSEWKRDLMAKGASGEVWRIELKSGNASKLASNLSYPYGVCIVEGGLAISEAWKHRVVLLDNSGKIKPVLEDLPGYPARLIALPQGGYALSIFAPRNQLVEFVLREPEFLRAMTATVHPNHWIAPKLMWGEGFKEPMQGAALKTMGIIKPWAPTWSYGLVVLLDDQFDAVSSMHSRADGKRHGVTSLCINENDLYANAKGAGVVVKFPLGKPMEAN